MITLVAEKAEPQAKFMKRLWFGKGGSNFKQVTKREDMTLILTDSAT